MDEQKENVSVYTNLSYIFETMGMSVPGTKIDFTCANDLYLFIESEINERILTALALLVDFIVKCPYPVQNADYVTIDIQIAEIDRTISRQLDEILHHPVFQNMESVWRSLLFLVNHTDSAGNVKIDILSVSKEELAEDFEDASEVAQSGLYKNVYTDEFDTPGGEPYGAIISSYEFTSDVKDIALLQQISRISASCHCPFIAGAAPQMFGKESMHELMMIADIHSYMERSEFLRWNTFRKSEDSRYVGLTVPRFMLRLPYGSGVQQVKDLNYTEMVNGFDCKNHLWGNASFAFAANMVRSFIENGWCVQIRGPQSGGRVEDLRIHNIGTGIGKKMKLPTEILIPETLDQEFAQEGFIPLSFFRNCNCACFFSANSTQKPIECEDQILNTNMKINSRLPYIFLASRIGHYLKVIQRENIGSTKSKQVLQYELNKWVGSLVTEMNDPGPELIATHPLKAGKVIVQEVADNPGLFFVHLSVTPHFQIEGISINLSIVSRMPKGR